MRIFVHRILEDNEEPRFALSVEGTDHVESFDSEGGFRAALSSRNFSMTESEAILRTLNLRGIMVIDVPEGGAVAPNGLTPAPQPAS